MSARFRASAFGGMLDRGGALLRPTSSGGDICPSVHGRGKYVSLRGENLFSKRRTGFGFLWVFWDFWDILDFLDCLDLF